MSRRLARTNGFIRSRVDSNEMNDPDSGENDRHSSIPALAALAVAACVPENIPFNTSNSTSKTMSNASTISSVMSNSSGNLDLLENRYNSSNIVKHKDTGEDPSDADLIDTVIDEREGESKSNVKTVSTSSSIELNGISINNSGNANTNANNSGSKIREGLSHVNDAKYKLFRWSNIVQSHHLVCEYCCVNKDNISFSVF